jgi:2'-5' RNA ligase
MLRLFVCIWIPEELKEKIVNLQEEIRNVPIIAKFVERENMHLTITFLGNIRDEDVVSLKNKLDMTTKYIKKFQIKLSGLKVIPNEYYVRVLGVDVKGSEKFIDLIKNVGDTVGGKYYETNKLTLCRVKKVKDKKMLRDFIEKNRNVEIGDFEVKNIALVKSVLTRNGPLYKTLHESELQ